MTCKEKDVNKLAIKLKLLGINYNLAVKNLSRCDIYFIEDLNKVLK